MRKTLVRLLALASVAIAPSAVGANPALYSQPYDGSGNLYASQNDTNGGGFGNFATVYDNFSLAGSGQYNITNLGFTGGYFNPPSVGSTSGFDVGLYANNAGQPGSLLWSGSFPGTANESCGAPSGNALICTYSLGLNFAVNAGTEYWLSIVNDSPYPPQWGWAQGTGGDSSSYQDFFGTRSQRSNDLAFSLYGNRGGAVPEPATWAMMLLGFGSIGLMVRRRRPQKRNFSPQFA